MLKDLILILLCGLKEEVALNVKLVLQLARAGANRLMGVTVYWGPEARLALLKIYECFRGISE